MQYIKIDPICYLFLQVKDPHTSNAIQVVLAYALQVKDPHTSNAIQVVLAYALVFQRGRKDKRTEPQHTRF
jgi:hypothetical protein